MTMTDAVRAEIDAEIMSDRFKRNPYPLYNRLREEHPVYWCEPWSAFLLTRFDDVSVALKESARFSSEGRHAAFMSKLDEQERAAALKKTRTMLDSDPPDHTRLRRLSHKAFSPRGVEALRDAVRSDVDELLARVTRPGTFDLNQLVGRPIPAITIARMMGLPIEEHEQFLDWVEGVITYWTTTPPTPETAALMARVSRETNAYFTDFIARTRGNPPPTIVGELMRAQEAGDKLSEPELVTYCSTLLNAASDTTRSLIGNTVVEVFGNTDLVQRLRADRSLVPLAIEETLRLTSPLLRAPRVVTHDEDLHGVHIPARSLVFAIMAGANRDPRVFDHPDEFDLDRASNTKHIGFGLGRHFCIGAPIARLQVEVVLHALLDRFDEISLASVEWMPLHLVRSPASVVLNVG